MAGLAIHMITGAMYGVGFALLVRRFRDARTLVAAGMAYGVGALLLSGFVGLPAAAAITNAGTTISHMADKVGWGTFAVEHVIFGMALGAGVVTVRRLTRAVVEVQ